MYFVFKGMKKEFLFVLGLMVLLVWAGSVSAQSVNYSVSCEVDADCVLGIPELRMQCGPCPVCAPENGSSSSVIAHNKNWTASCPETDEDYSCPAIACSAKDYGSQGYYAKCVNSQCEKIYLGSEGGLYGCELDPFVCPNNITVFRDPTNSCEFPACPEEVECVAQGGMCGGIAGFACCSGLRCELEGDFPDAGGTCIVDLPGDICEDSCGNGLCDEFACQGDECPCPETRDSCPADCSVVPDLPASSEDGLSNWWIFIVLVVLVLIVIVGLKIAKWLMWAAIIAALLFVILSLFVF